MTSSIPPVPPPISSIPPPPKFFDGDYRFRIVSPPPPPMEGPPARPISSGFYETPISRDRLLDQLRCQNPMTKLRNVITSDKSSPLISTNPGHISIPSSTDWSDSYRPPMGKGVHNRETGPFKIDQMQESELRLKMPSVVTKEQITEVSKSMEKSPTNHHKVVTTSVVLPPSSIRTRRRFPTAINNVYRVHGKDQEVDAVNVYPQVKLQVQQADKPKPINIVRPVITTTSFLPSVTVDPKQEEMKQDEIMQNDVMTPVNGDLSKRHRDVMCGEQGVRSRTAIIEAMSGASAVSSDSSSPVRLDPSPLNIHEMGPDSAKSYSPTSAPVAIQYQNHSDLRALTPRHMTHGLNEIGTQLNSVPKPSRPYCAATQFQNGVAKMNGEPPAITFTKHRLARSNREWPLSVDRLSGTGCSAYVEPHAAQHMAHLRSLGVDETDAVTSGHSAVKTNVVQVCHVNAKRNASLPCQMQNSNGEIGSATCLDQTRQTTSTRTTPDAYLEDPAKLKKMMTWRQQKSQIKGTVGETNFARTLNNSMASCMTSQHITHTSANLTDSESAKLQNPELRM